MSATADRALLDDRDRDRVDSELPRTIDGARRGRLLARDAVSTTWEAFSVETGARLWLRCLRPRWRDDAAVRRRLRAGLALAVPGPLWWGDGGWPHMRWERPGQPLAELLPVDEPAPLAMRIQLLAAGLGTLDRLHRGGAVLGEPVGEVLVVGGQGPRLLWRDPFGAEADPRDELAALARIVTALAPDAGDPVAVLARAWTEDPPLAAADGLVLLRRAMGAALLRRRHALVLLARNTQRRSRVARLARAVGALERVLPPPALRCCVRAEHFAGLVIVASGPDGVHCGTVDDPQAELDQCVWSPEQGLDPVANRQVLRAWNRRKGGAEDRRAVAQAALAADDPTTRALMRWLSAMARLRSARMLLDLDGGSL